MRRERANHHQAERGVAIIAVVVVIALSMALFGLWAQASVREHRRLESLALQMQAQRLAESGVARALVRRASNAEYAEENWSIPANELGGRHAAEVLIRVEPAAAALRIQATADFPAGAVQRARVTRQIEIPNPVSGDES